MVGKKRFSALKWILFYIKRMYILHFNKKRMIVWKMYTINCTVNYDVIMLRDVTDSSGLYDYAFNWIWNLWSSFFVKHQSCWHAIFGDDMFPARRVVGKSLLFSYRYSHLLDNHVIIVCGFYQNRKRSGFAESRNIYKSCNVVTLTLWRYDVRIESSHGNNSLQIALFYE